jgi:hypothetical protein
VIASDRSGTKHTSLGAPPEIAQTRVIELSLDSTFVSQQGEGSINHHISPTCLRSDKEGACVPNRRSKRKPEAAYSTKEQERNCDEPYKLRGYMLGSKLHVLHITPFPFIVQNSNSGPRERKTLRRSRFRRF